MNLAMVRLYCGNSGQIGYYNSQELGLAKALVKYGIQVYIMILNDKIKKIDEEIVSPNITVIYIPAKSIGNHGFFNCDNLMKYKIDVVHLQSDNQIYAPHVMKYCKKQNIKCYNYVGTFYSDSSNILKQKIMNLVSNRNARYLKKFTTFSKTPTVQKQLERKNVKSKVVPVGLDIEIIPTIKESKEELRVRLGFPVDKNILLYVGRLENYKKPFDAIELIKKVNDEYILIMIGEGSLKDAISEKVKRYCIEDKVIYIDSIPNKYIHEYYKLSDFFVNFNDKEIFGMSILEAMYNECIVIANTAPGPSYIIEHNISGYLTNSLNEMIFYIKNSNSEISLNARKRIMGNFTWDNSGKIINEYLKGEL